MPRERQLDLGWLNQPLLQLSSARRVEVKTLLAAVEIARTATRLHGRIYRVVEAAASAGRLPMWVVEPTPVDEQFAMDVERLIGHGFHPVPLVWYLDGHIKPAPGGAR